MAECLKTATCCRRARFSAARRSRGARKVRGSERRLPGRSPWAGSLGGGIGRFYSAGGRESKRHKPLPCNENQIVARHRLRSITKFDPLYQRGIAMKSSLTHPVPPRPAGPQSNSTRRFCHEPFQARLDHRGAGCLPVLFAAVVALLAGTAQAANTNDNVVGTPLTWASRRLPPIQRQTRSDKRRHLRVRHHVHERGFAPAE